MSKETHNYHPERSPRSEGSLRRSTNITALFLSNEGKDPVNVTRERPQGFFGKSQNDSYKYPDSIAVVENVQFKHTETSLEGKTIWAIMCW